MKSLRNFLVKVPKKTENTVNVGGKEIFIETKFNEFDHRISFGEILSVPAKFDTGAEPGDTLIFHHHVTSSKGLDVGEDTYIVNHDEGVGTLSHAFAYRRKSDGELVMLCDWLFVQPIDDPEDDVEDSGIVTKLGAFKERRDVAKVYMPHPDLSRQGVVPGDIVGFEKHSDYKVKLDNGDVVYRMRVSNISYVEVQEELHND